MYLPTTSEILQRMSKDNVGPHSKEYLCIDIKLDSDDVVVHHFKRHIFFTARMWAYKKWKNTWQKLRAMKKDWEKHISRKKVL